MLERNKVEGQAIRSPILVGSFKAIAGVGVLKGPPSGISG